jgi:hypothetical protein
MHTHLARGNILRYDALIWRFPSFSLFSGHGTRWGACARVSVHQVTPGLAAMEIWTGV